MELWPRPLIHRIGSQHSQWNFRPRATERRVATRLVTGCHPKDGCFICVSSVPSIRPLNEALAVRLVSANYQTRTAEKIKLPVEMVFARGSSKMSQHEVPMDLPTDKRLIRLAEGDDVLVVIERLRAGERYLVAGVENQAARDLGLGHKVAARAISTGERVLKYGAPIGRASQSIAIGEHVHVHNLVSDYTPTYTLPEQAA